MALKPKYAKTMLNQLHIFDTKAANLIVQEAYLTNAFINPKRRIKIFFKIDLLLEYQNGKFKCF